MPRREIPIVVVEYKIKNILKEVHKLFIHKKYSYYAVTMRANKAANIPAIYPHLGGYDLTLFEEGQNTEKYKCALCHKVLKKSMQLLNGPVPTRACHGCYTENIR